MTQMPSESQVRADLAAMGFRDKLSEEDFELSVRDELHARESKASTPLVSLRQSVTTMKTGTESTPKIDLPPRDYECATCEDSKFVLTSTRFDADHPTRRIRMNPVPCPRCVPLAVRAKASGIDGRFVNANLAVMQERRGNAGALAYARQWDGKASVLITSRTGSDGEATAGDDSLWGTGKTTIACAMLIGQIAKGRPAKFLYVRDFLSNIQSQFDGESNAVQTYIEHVADEPLLALDDLGAERGTDWTREQMRTLIDTRYRRQHTTIITSNYGTLERIATEVGGAVASRLREYTHIRVGGSDLRGVAAQ